MDVARTKSIQPDLIGSIFDLPDEVTGVTSVYLGHILEHLEFDLIPAALAKLWERCEQGCMVAAVGPDCDIGRAWVDAGKISEKEYRKMDITPPELIPGGSHNGYSHRWRCTTPLMVDLLVASGLGLVQKEDILSSKLKPFPVVCKIGWQGAVIGVVQ